MIDTVKDELETMLEKIALVSRGTFTEVAQYIRDSYRGLLPPSDIIASDVSLEDYMERYAADHCEWVEGNVIEMAPATIQHNSLIKYLSTFFDVYFELRPIGVLVIQGRG